MRRCLRNCRPELRSLRVKGCAGKRLRSQEIKELKCEAKLCRSTREHFSTNPSPDLLDSQNNTQTHTRKRRSCLDSLARFTAPTATTVAHHFKTRSQSARKRSVAVQGVYQSREGFGAATKSAARHAKKFDRGQHLY